MQTKKYNQKYYLEIVRYDPDLLRMPDLAWFDMDTDTGYTGLNNQTCKNEDVLQASLANKVTKKKKEKRIIIYECKQISV